MREISLVTLIILCLALLAFLGRMPLDRALIIGGWMTGGGLIIGIPSGIIYHYYLYKEFLRAGTVPKGWIWRPTELHHLVPEQYRKNFMPYCVVGAAACGVIFFGCAIIFIAAVSEWNTLRS